MCFVGTRLKGAAAPGFEFGIRRADRVGFEVEPHGHRCAHVMWAMAGPYETAAEGATPPGRDVLVYNPPGVFHTDRLLSRGVFFFTVNVDPADLEALTGARLPTAPRQIASERPRALLRRLAGECAGWSADSALVAEGLSLELMSAVTAPPRQARDRNPAWLARACAMLRETPPASIGAVAAEAGVHPTHLVRTFRMAFDCTPGDYARACRLERAAAMLGTHRPEISRIAFESGFADQSHLTRAFKRAFGMTPAAYRSALAV